jgi:hypothetical protein
MAGRSLTIIGAMSRGPGAVQRRILAALTDTGDKWTPVRELAGATPAQRESARRRSARPRRSWQGRNPHRGPTSTTAHGVDRQLRHIRTSARSSAPLRKTGPAPTTPECGCMGSSDPKTGPADPRVSVGRTILGSVQTKIHRCGHGPARRGGGVFEGCPPGRTA